MTEQTGRPDNLPETPGYCISVHHVFGGIAQGFSLGEGMNLGKKFSFGSKIPSKNIANHKIYKIPIKINENNFKDVFRYGVPDTIRNDFLKD